MPASRRVTTTFGNRSGSTVRMSSHTHPVASARIRSRTAALTWSRGASSSVKRLPAVSRRTAPSPLLAPVSSAPSLGSPGLARAVGWNWQNSRSARAPPATWASTGPAPIAPHGFVVRSHSAAAPPAASTVAAAAISPRSVTTPAHRRPSLQSATAEVCSRTSTPGCASTSSASLPVSARPVWLPPEWTIRRAECPPSSPSARLPSSARSNSTPSRCSSATAPGASRTRISTADGRHAPRPALSVSSACRSGESSSASAAASPPWARKLALSDSGFRETRHTRAPRSAATSAVYRPAAPAPTTTTSRGEVSGAAVKARVRYSRGCDRGAAGVDLRLAALRQHVAPRSTVLPARDCPGDADRDGEAGSEGDAVATPSASARPVAARGGADRRAVPAPAPDPADADQVRSRRSGQPGDDHPERNPRGRRALLLRKPVRECLATRAAAPDPGPPLGAGRARGRRAGARRPGRGDQGAERLPRRGADHVAAAAVPPRLPGPGRPRRDRLDDGRDERRVARRAAHGAPRKRRAAPGVRALGGPHLARAHHGRRASLPRTRSGAALEAALRGPAGGYAGDLAPARGLARNPALRRRAAGGDRRESVRGDSIR